MAMSRKHYNAVAAFLVDAQLRDTTHPHHVTDAEWTRRYIAIRLADLFADDNPAFDRDRFFEAAGIRC